MSDRLTTEEELAERLVLPLAKTVELRRAHRWPHVRLGRFTIRYTPEQVAAIIALETVKPTQAKTAGLAGQTSRSARRAS